jgi:DNA-binding transcriptional ArsR family regulator
MEPEGGPRSQTANRTWRLLSRHGFVLFFLALKPDSTMREMSLTLSMTERTLYSVIKDLSDAGMVRVSRVGRTNSYSVNGDAHFIDPMFAHLRVSMAIDALKPSLTSREAR